MRKFEVFYYIFDGFDVVKSSEIVEANDFDGAEKVILEKYGENANIIEIFDKFDTPLNDKLILIDMPDGFTYGIPVMVIAEDRASKYENEYGANEDNFYLSMTEDTLPLFESNEKEIIDWAKSNMNFADVKDKAHILKKKEDFDYEDVWANGNMVIK